MKLKGGTSFLGMPDLGDTLLLRECYGGLEEKLQKLFEDGARAVAVIGNPGEECSAVVLPWPLTLLGVGL